MPRCAHCKADGPGRHDTVAEVRACATRHEIPEERRWDARPWNDEAAEAFRRIWGRTQPPEPPF